MKFIPNISFFGLLMTPMQLIAAQDTPEIPLAACGGKPNHCPKQITSVAFDVDPDKEVYYGVRCCSEEQFHLSEIKEKFGCKVWAGSKDANHQCVTRGLYDEAKQHCASMGARLCTCNELLNKCAKGTGCGLNKKLVWCHA